MRGATRFDEDGDGNDNGDNDDGNTDDGNTDGDGDHGDDDGDGVAMMKDGRDDDID